MEEVVMDMNENQVTVKGVLDPQAVCNKIKKKTKRMAKVLSPLPAAEGEPLPPTINSQVSGLTTVELNVNMHCQACADQLKKKILKMKGIHMCIGSSQNQNTPIYCTKFLILLIYNVYTKII